jgi:hypothetical protein
MTIFVLHRVNTLEKLNEVSNEKGAEIDLRLHYGKLVLAHDPLEDGCEFVNWLPNYKGSLLVLNVKEMGLENIILQELKKANRVIDYFFLDQAVPYLHDSVRQGIECSARVSEYESLESACLIQTSWLWVDSFTGNWDHLNKIDSLPSQIRSTKKVCLVSPELQKRSLEGSDEINLIVKKLKELNLKPNAVCTKFPEIWGRYLQ